MLSVGIVIFIKECEADDKACNSPSDSSNSRSNPHDPLLNFHQSRSASPHSQPLNASKTVCTSILSQSK